MFKFLRVYYRFLLRRKIIFGVFLVSAIAAEVLYGITPYFYKLFVDALPDLNYLTLINILILYIAIRIGAAIAISVFALFLTVKFTISYNLKTRGKFNVAEDDVSGVIVNNFVNALS